MCGIAAVAADNGIDPDFVQSSAWTRCLRAIERRGPDGTAFWSSPSGAAILGHTRLAIVDPSDRGSQPMVARRGTAAITYNGEIYNAPALRTELERRGHRFQSLCDTEVLLLGWIEWGEGVLERIEGMYAFVAWDDDTRELTAAVDHAGMKPLYWKREPGRLLLASTADAIRALTAGEEPLDASSLRRVLTLSCSPAPSTMWEGVSKLEPGRVLRWKPGMAPQIRAHWSPPENIDADVPSLGDGFVHLFEQVVREHMFADVPVGAFLSAGLDSAAIVAAACQAGVRPACYTLSMDGADDESGGAARVAQHLSLEHTIAPAGAHLADDLADCAAAYDEPQGYSALLNATRISRLARSQHKAVIAGDGGDEAFGGYLWQRESGPHAWQTLPARPNLIGDSAALAQAVSSAAADDETRKLARLAFGSRSFPAAYATRVFPGFHPAEAFALTHTLGGSFDDEDAVGWLDQEDRPSLPHIRRVQRLDLLGFCAASILPKIDRAAMHVGLEVRAPLLDRRLLTVGMAAPVLPAERDETGAGSRPGLRNYVSTRLGPSFASREKQGFSLRLRSELTQWRALAETVDRGFLVQSQTLRPDWREFVPVGDTPRLRLLAMLTAWADARFSHCP